MAKNNKANKQGTAEFGNSQYLIVPFWYLTTVDQARVFDLRLGISMDPLLCM